MDGRIEIIGFAVSWSVECLKMNFYCNIDVKKVG